MKKQLLQYVEQTYELDSESALEIVDEFIATFDEKIADLKKAIANGDAELFRRSAHTLKGCSTYVGFTPLYEHVRGMEKIDVHSNTDEAMTILETFRRSINA